MAGATSEPIRSIRPTGKWVTESYHHVITVAVLIPRLFRQTVARLFRPISAWRLPLIWQSLVQIGIGSLPIVVISTTVAGVVTTNVIAWHMDFLLHSVEMIPGFTGQFILRELGIAIPALLLVAKVGASITAEVGSMKITEQIDALRLLGIDPVCYLVFPRFVASIVASVCLTVVAICVTLVFATLIAVINYHFGMMEYINSVRHFIGPRDLLCAFVKAVCYGAVIPVISCAYGFECKGGAEGVGTAATNSVVTSTVVVIILDFNLTYLFSHFL